MFNMLKGFILSIAMLMLSFPAYAEEVSKEQIKGLDEQVQEIKTDVLGIAAQLNLLEEKLLYPSNTQVAVFVSLDNGAKFPPRFDGDPAGRQAGRSSPLHLQGARSAAEGGGAAHLYRQCQIRRARPAGTPDRQNRGRIRSPRNGKLSSSTRMWDPRWWRFTWPVPMLKLSPLRIGSVCPDCLSCWLPCCSQRLHWRPAQPRQKT